MGSVNLSSGGGFHARRAYLRVCIILCLTVLVALVVCGPAMGYVSGKRVWLRASGTAAHERSFRAVAKGPNGVIYAAGYVHTSAARKGDILVVKYDAAGVLKWTRTWAGVGAADDWALDAAVDAKGNLYVLGRSDTPTVRLVVLKYSATGVRKWAKTRVGGDVWGYALAVDRSGNALVCSTTQVNATQQAIVVAKRRAADGALKWETRFAPNPADPDAGGMYAADMALDAAGNAFVAGSSTYLGVRQAAVYKFSGATGERLKGELDTPGWGSQATAVAVRGQTVVIAGWAAKAANEEGYLVVKYDLDLAEQHRTEYHNTADAGARDSANDVAIGARGGVYVTGTSNRPPAGGHGYYNGCQTVRFSSDLGTVVWYKIFQPGGGAVSGASGDHLVLDAAGNAYVAGYLETDATWEDLLVVKYAANGAFKWKQRWDGGDDDDGANDLTLGGTTAVYVVGYGYARGGFEKGVAMRINR